MTEVAKATQALKALRVQASECYAWGVAAAVSASAGRTVDAREAAESAERLRPAFRHGFFTVIDFENAIFTTAFGINAAGDIVGQYDTSEKCHGYLFSQAGVFTSIDLPNTQGSSPFGTRDQSSTRVPRQLPSTSSKGTSSIWRSASALAGSQAGIGAGWTSRVSLGANEPARLVDELREGEVFGRYLAGVVGVFNRATQGDRLTKH